MVTPSRGTPGAREPSTACSLIVGRPPAEPSTSHGSGAFVRLDRPADARSALVAARDGWHPTSGGDEAELNFVAALVERDLGRLDVAEQLAASAVRLRNDTSDRRAALVERIALAQVHVLAGKRNLRMAESVICDVPQLRSQRARDRLAPLADALDARLGRDARELAVHARRVAAVPA